MKSNQSNFNLRSPGSYLVRRYIITTVKISLALLKMSQINYVSRNQLHCRANLNFGLISKKAKHYWALSTNFLFLFSCVIVFLDHVLLLDVWAQKFKLLQNSCMAKLQRKQRQQFERNAFKTAEAELAIKNDLLFLYHT